MFILQDVVTVAFGANMVWVPVGSIGPLGDNLIKKLFVRTIHRVFSCLRCSFPQTLHPVHTLPEGHCPSPNLHFSRKQWGGEDPISTWLAPSSSGSHGSVMYFPWPPRPAFPPVLRHMEAPVMARPWPVCLTRAPSSGGSWHEFHL